MKAVIVLGLVGGLMTSPAWADSIHIGNTTNNQGGNASATSTNVNVNTQSQGQQQGQYQGQSQVGVNVQGQKQDASNAGNHQSVKVESQMIPGVAVAPGLAAGGSQVCLGSFSVGLSGPMAGIAFGKTVQDKGCEKRHLFILLHNTNDPRAKSVLDSLYEESMGSAKEQPKTAAVPASGGIVGAHAARVDSIQGN